MIFFDLRLVDNQCLKIFYVSKLQKTDMVMLFWERDSLVIRLNFFVTNIGEREFRVLKFKENKKTIQTRK